jgi:hypothetical protein
MDCVGVRSEQSCNDCLEHDVKDGHVSTIGFTGVRLDVFPSQAGPFQNRRHDLLQVEVLKRYDSVRKILPCDRRIVELLYGQVVYHVCYLVVGDQWQSSMETMDEKNTQNDFCGKKLGTSRDKQRRYGVVGQSIEVLRFASMRFIGADFVSRPSIFCLV